MNDLIQNLAYSVRRIALAMIANAIFLYALTVVSQTLRHGPPADISELKLLPFGLMVMAIMCGFFGGISGFLVGAAQPRILYRIGSPVLPALAVALVVYGTFILIPVFVFRPPNLERSQTGLILLFINVFIANIGTILITDRALPHRPRQRFVPESCQ